MSVPWHNLLRSLNERVDDFEDFPAASSQVLSVADDCSRLSEFQA